MIVLGIDGGGSTTRAVLADVSGHVLGHGTSGASNPVSMGVEQCAVAIDEAVSAAWASAKRTRAPVAAAGVGIAGLVTGAEVTLVRTEITRLGLVAADGSADLEGDPDSRTCVTHDLEIALTGGLGSGAGVVLIAGTGSASFARGPSGHRVIVGGKGALAGDSGSAYWVAHRALRKAVKQMDGREPRTALAEVVMDFLGITTAEHLVEALREADLSTPQLATLCPRVVGLARYGDLGAAPIVGQAYAALAHMAATAARQTDLSAPDVILTGGLATSSDFRPGLEAALRAAIRGLRLQEPQVPPVGGALLLALNALGVTRSGPLMENIRASL